MIFVRKHDDDDMPDEGMLQDGVDLRSKSKFTSELKHMFTTEQMPILVLGFARTCLTKWVRYPFR